MIEQLTGLYPISKTLRFKLIPVGKTEENFNRKLLLEKDKQRAEDYQKVKGFIDRFYQTYIERVLGTVHYIDGLTEYAELYYRYGKNKKDEKDAEASEAKMRKQIADAFAKDNEFGEIKKPKYVIEQILPDFVEDDEKEIVARFYQFSTYFVGFFTNRANMFSAEKQSTAISYRCINDNLPKFLDNCKSFRGILSALPQDVLKPIAETAFLTYGIEIENAFQVDYFPFVLSQSGIDRYNGIIGGYTNTNGSKIKGVNEIINLYNQQIAKVDKSKRLPLLKPLYKQILSKSETVSFIPEKFTNDDELLNAVNTFYMQNLSKPLIELTDLFAELDTYCLDRIYVSFGTSLTGLSNAVFRNWNAVLLGWEDEYRAANPISKRKTQEKYEEEMAQAYKRNKSFSLTDIRRYGEKHKTDDAQGNVTAYYKQAISEATAKIILAYERAQLLFTTDYSSQNNKKLCSNEQAIEQIKNLLDAVKELEWLIKPLLGTGKEEKDEVFYGKFLTLYDMVAEVDKLYDKVRNHVTQKPYSSDKIKLNFDNPQLLGGWDKNKEKDYRTVLLRKNGTYFLAVMDGANNSLFVNAPLGSGENFYEKMDYKLLPGPNKMLPKVFFASSNIQKFQPSEEILRIRQKESFKKGTAFCIEDCRKLIDFYKASIEKHEDWSKFGFKFSDTESYRDISEFYKEISEQGYKVSFSTVSEEYINRCVEQGALYLFKLYNKDFSENSHGTPNLHTLYFKMVFDERNLADTVFKLNGEAEMFFREPSLTISETTVHPANQPLSSKNPDNPKKTSEFTYDIIKDKRYTVGQFSLHIPITMNFKATGRGYLNDNVMHLLQNSNTTHVIGIDRGERHLIYISVINQNGEIMEQHTLNEIIGDNGYTVDYQKLLAEKEKKRDEARKNWSTIENIKELKEGYLSQVVHKICELVMKYDAVIAMENLNYGFKNGRFKVERQVYQKFENMLISKLNFLADKKTDAEQSGGILHAYQLTNQFNGVNKSRQNGIIFFVPAWLTSKIDPTTGFVDLLKPKYTTTAEAKSFFNKFDSIVYKADEDMFAFSFHYDNFPKATADYRKNWTVYSNADRILTFRNPDNNNQWDNKTVWLTKEFKRLLDAYHVDYTQNIQVQIAKIEQKDFWYSFINLFKLTLQMRNSIPNSTNPKDDYLISPVKNSAGKFYDSRKPAESDVVLPTDADANGAYHIAKKGLWVINQIKNTPEDELDNVNISISQAEWLKLQQER